MVKVIGKKKLDYTNKNGRQVKGTELVYLFVASQYEGYNAERVYCPGVLADNVAIGDEVELLYNKLGYVVEIKKNKKG